MRDQSSSVSLPVRRCDWLTRPIEPIMRKLSCSADISMLLWSFVRDDLPRSVVCRQIALALRDEVSDLEAAGITPVETDLGEYIIQLRNEMPSHIIAPSVHVTAAQVEQDFRRVHKGLDAKRDLSEPVKLLSEAWPSPVTLERTTCPSPPWVRITILLVASVPVSARSKA